MEYALEGSASRWEERSRQVVCEVAEKKVSTAEDSKTSDEQVRAEPPTTGGAAAIGSSKSEQASGAVPATQKRTRQGTGKVRKGDAALLVGNAVTFRTAEQYLGIKDRQRQKLMKSGALKVVGKGHPRKITTDSLRDYVPPETPN
jgi:hypothetical protein